MNLTDFKEFEVMKTNHFTGGKCIASTIAPGGGGVTILDYEGEELDKQNGDNYDDSKGDPYLDCP